MIHYLIACPISAPTGRALATAISEKQSQKCYFYARKNPIKNLDKKHIRYGSLIPTSNNGINKIEDICAASQKLIALKILNEYGVGIPKIFEKPFQPVYDVPILFRKNRHHAGNDSPLFLEKNTEIQPIHQEYHYALEYIKNAYEYRVHVFRGSVIRVQKKMRISDVENDPFIRSANRGWVLRQSKRAGIPDTVIEQSVMAVSCIGLDFGSVDILYKRGYDKTYVLEINTAPGLNEWGIAAYVEAIMQWDRGE